MSKNDVRPQTRKRTKKKTRKPSSFLNLLCFILSILSLLLVGLLIYQFFALDMFPLTLLLPIGAIFVLITLLLLIFMNVKCRKVGSRVAMMFLVAVLSVGYGLGNYYIFRLNHLFEEVTNLTDKTAHSINVVTMAGSGYSTLADLDDKIVGTISELDPEGTSRCLADVEEQNVTFDTVEYSSAYDLAYALYDGQVDAIILNESYEGELHEYELTTNFGVSTNKIHQTLYYTDKTASQSESLNAVNSIATDSFTILISGNDSYGTLGENSRSDVNMLVTINPSTHTVLMTSLPRDYYVEYACAADGDGCPEGQASKLTHTGLYGVETTDETLEQLLGITINYTVRVNFSSLVNIVDAVGGIDVYVEEGLEVDTFYANGTEGVDAGWNHLNGERALAFARERYAYADGDMQRIKNQQIVLEALIQKIVSPSMIVNFGSFVDAVSTAFETNMPANQIRGFIRYQFTMMPEWSFESFALMGLSSTEYCPTQGDYASVVIPYEEYVQAAADKINAVSSGGLASDVEDPPVDGSLLTLRTYDDVQTEDQTQDTQTTPDADPDDSSIYDEPVTQDPSYYEDPIVYDSSTYDSSSGYYDPNAVYY